MSLVGKASQQARHKKMFYFILDSKGPNVFPNAIMSSFFRLDCWKRDPRSRLDQHPAERGWPWDATSWETKRKLHVFLSSSLSSSHSRSRRSDKRELALLMGLTILAWRKQHLKRGTYNHFWWNNYHSLFPSKWEYLQTCDCLEEC